MKELILTGIPELWAEDEQNAVFFGPWCFADNPEYDFWDQARFTLAPRPWKSKLDILLASRYLDSVIDKIIPVSAQYLNDWHGTDYSERFWAIALNCWLVHWLGIIYDRFKRLEYLGQAYSQQRFAVRVMRPDVPVERFSRKSLDHYTNLCVLSQIVHLARFHFLEKNVITEISGPFYSGPKEPPSQPDKRLEGRLKRDLKNRFGERMASLSGIRWGNVWGLSGRDRLILSVSVLARRQNKAIRQIGIRRNKAGAKQCFRNGALPFKTENLFEEVISRMILSHLPSNVFCLTNDQLLRSRKAKVWIGNDIWNPQLALEIASVIESGGQWISVQHGGGYGQYSSFPVGKMEYAVADGFISWGWSKPHLYDCPVFALPSPLLTKLPRHEARTEKLIFIGTATPPYCNRLDSTIKPEELLPYLLNKENFLQALNTNIRALVHYRPYRHNFGVDERKWILRLLKQSQMLDDGRLSDHMGQARLVVIDHLATSLIECMAMGVPTICFWSPEHFKESEEARPYFDRLRDAEILHDSPKAAARKVNEIWNDVASWWNSETVQTARDRFCRQYALTSKSWRWEWAKFLRSYLGSGPI